ncbi:CRISPR-associated endonuclease Cas1 [Methanocorpusculaceae archaeon Cs1]|uniref:CRISPR-associated endonuclease Cas1 n=2 Tax=Methanorbis rubei TaxID=3028300 RepID=A0AAE4SCV3_9EURY|nr:CRISPR-associated endonuclease Cas1 [Methanocorpusculaceae archaeon Cs1]
MIPDVSWVTVWGYGSDIRATQKMLIVRDKSAKTAYPLSSLQHLLVVGGHTLETAAISHLIANNISVSFFDIHGEPVGSIRPFGGDACPLRSAQKNLPIHSSAMSVITSAVKSRMMYLNELASGRDDGLFYKGELEILSDASRELEFLITLPELGRIFTLTRNMYYEILSRTVAPEFGYHRREKPPYVDPINAMFAHGYAVLYASISVAAAGAGLDPEIGALYGSVVPTGKNRGGCVLDIMEPLMTPMVDRVVVGMATEDRLSHRYEVSSRCIMSERLMKEFNLRLAESVDSAVINRNVRMYADAVSNGGSGMSF